MIVSDVQRFRGFAQEGLQFLAELAENNDRAWFQPRKADYEALLLLPAQQFVAELGERMLDFAPGLTFDTGTSGTGSILRIYRDTRFSKDKQPYHTHLRMVLWEGPCKKMENPSFWVGISADGAGLYAGIHMFNKLLLPAYRNAVLDDETGMRLQLAVDAVEQADGYRIGGQHYKSVPRGYDPAHARAALLRHNGLHVVLPQIAPEIVTTPGLVDICASQFEHTLPVHEWLVELLSAVEG